MKYHWAWDFEIGHVNSQDGWLVYVIARISKSRYLGWASVPVFRAGLRCWHTLDAYRNFTTQICLYRPWT